MRRSLTRYGAWTAETVGRDDSPARSVYLSGRGLIHGVVDRMNLPSLVRDRNFNAYMIQNVHGWNSWLWYQDHDHTHPKYSNVLLARQLNTASSVIRMRFSDGVNLP